MSINERSEGQKASSDAMGHDGVDGAQGSVPLLAPLSGPSMSGNVQ